jgi:ABC-type Fe3+ transport system permease subunit
MHSGISVVTALVVTVVLFSLGYARAVWVRAKRDYQTRKAAVKPLRKSTWSAIWRAFRIGLGAAVIYAIIVT